MNYEMKPEGYKRETKKREGDWENREWRMGKDGREHTKGFEFEFEFVYSPNINIKEKYS